MAGVSRGAAGEVLAARFLRDKGYKLLSSNFRCRQGEIDVIAQKDGFLVFVEIKTRQRDSMYLPREAVTGAKQRRLIQTAGVFLSRFPTKLQPRFDVIEVVTESADSLKVVEINHIVGAYEAGGLSSAF